MRLKLSKIAIPIVVLAILGGWVVLSTLTQPRVGDSDIAWEAMANPGSLSKAHAFLGNNCAACHTPNKGVDSASCIACHSNNLALLQRQPTAFHANVQSCVDCHSEHEGVNRRRLPMNHAAFADIARRQLDSEIATGSNDAAVDAGHARLAAWIDQREDLKILPVGHPNLTAGEAALNCYTCHANQDRHRQMFGTNCIQCHATTTWTIPEYRHPSPTSVSCVQCHQAPPSHYMMHFEMVSMKVAGQEHAQVSECYKCHQTTSWNDINNVGWFKHH